MPSVTFKPPPFLPLRSFFSILSLKLGSQLICMFLILNKLAGIFGIAAALLTGVGNWSQISGYIYSVITIATCIWGLKGVNDENHKVLLPFANLYLFDHLINTAYTVLFATTWYYLTPHNGQRLSNSPIQEAIIHSDPSWTPHEPTAEEREATKLAAEKIWSEEKGFSATVLVASWFLKLYFCLVLYSFAMHLRRGTYKSLPLSSSEAVLGKTAQKNPSYRYQHLKTSSNVTTDFGEGMTEDDEDWEERNWRGAVPGNDYSNQYPRSPASAEVPANR